MSSSISLRPMYVASVSGGKDSYYMLNYIISNSDRYPLDLVVHYELEIDYPWIKDSVKSLESLCSSLNIKFLSIKPRFSFWSYADKRGLPSRVYRWCSNKYKADCSSQLKSFCRSLNCKPILYIGFCCDEVSRFKFQLNDSSAKEVYPLAENGISEDFVLSWARSHPLLKNWYTLFKRQGCMYCPMISRLELAYLYKFYPDQFFKFWDLVKAEENRFYVNKPYWYFDIKKNVDEFMQYVIDVYVPQLENLLLGADKYGQFSFDFKE